MMSIFPEQTSLHRVLMGQRDIYCYSLTARSRNALPITLTEDNAIAAAAKIGENKIPKNG